MIRSKPLYADLTHRIQVREALNTPTSSGNITTEYNIKARIWGRVRPLPMSYQIGIFVRDVQIEMKPTHTIRMRVNTELGVTRTGLQGNMYLYVEDKNEKGRSFRILSVLDKDDRRIELNVLVRELGIQYGTDNLT